MALNENIVTGRKFKKLIDEANNLWQKMSFWTKASDIEFDDGSTAETKIGAINGVTDSLTSTSSNIAASAAAVKALNDKVTELNSNLKPVYKTETKTTNIAFNSNEANVKRSGTAYFSGKVLGVTSIYCPDNNSPIASISISGNAVTITLLFKGTSSWTYSVSVTANIA